MFSRVLLINVIKENIRIDHEGIDIDYNIDLRLI